MFIYIIQTIFLLLIAFALGALVGYLLKRYFGCPAEVEAQTDAGVSASSDAASSSGATSATLAASEATVSGEASSAPTSDKGADAPVSGLMASTDAKAAAPKATAAKKTSAAKTTKTTAAKKAAAAAATGPDDLKLIKGVGKLNETRLNDEGITTFAQVAAWKKADIADFDEKLNFKGRIEREEWVPQAKVLAKGSTKKKPATASTAPAKKAAAPKTANASAATATASKKPSAKKPAAKKAAPKKAAPKAPAKPDDLKLIKGVGKLIETKLAKEGITQYSQIAAWKKADITDFDEKLSFKGRIERDDWIAQAKILAKGGTTDFSKRAAKGDVPSSS
jgi:predicted flap endonuclease-1-like 5' DNA nuclease